MCDCAEELEQRSSRSHPIPSPHSEASTPCGWSGYLPGFLGSSPIDGSTGNGWPKVWVPIISGTALSLLAILFKFKDNIKGLIWSSDIYDGFVPKKKRELQEKNMPCVCED